MESVTEKILLYLYNCVDYGFSYRAKKGLFISDVFYKDRIRADQKQIKDSIRDLSKYKFINKKQNYDGSITVSLTEKGILRALNDDFKNLKDRKEKWDGKWRMIAFDIPEEYRKGRKALTYRFKAGGFYELQKSLFLYPYDCKKEIMALVKIFKLEKYVRFAILESIYNQEHINKIFGLD